VAKHIGYFTAVFLYVCWPKGPFNNLPWWLPFFDVCQSKTCWISYHSGMFWHTMVAFGPFPHRWASHKTMWALRGALQGLHGAIPVLCQKILDKLPRWLLFFDLCWPKQILGKLPQWLLFFYLCQSKR
jgi:hypothetical protein